MTDSRQAILYFGDLCGCQELFLEKTVGAIDCIHKNRLNRFWTDMSPAEPAKVQKKIARRLNG